jgi:hypothetical protein
MTLNLNDRAASPGAYTTSQAFTDAVNDSRFVRTFGAVAIIGSILLFVFTGVEIGIGLAVMGFGSTRYYRVLGLAVVVLAIGGVLIAPVAFLAPVALSIGVGLKAIGVLQTLAAEGKGDPDWPETRSRAIIGLVLSGIGFLIAALWIALILISVFLRLR